ncbi:MAG: hypothetical protein M1834_002648 [Cirrosporium novae-zelandiae]|nr:MAG: hypothetical protein M1834_002648 [Cirrosporium novae-zelandiae]
MASIARSGVKFTQRLRDQALRNSTLSLIEEATTKPDLAHFTRAMLKIPAHTSHCNSKEHATVRLATEEQAAANKALGTRFDFKRPFLGSLDPEGPFPRQLHTFNTIYRATTEGIPNRFLQHMALLDVIAPKRIPDFSRLRIPKKYPSVFQLSSPQHKRTFLSYQNLSMQPQEDSTTLPELIYQWQEGRYRPGGYHPTYIGDKYLDGRYEVVHKLGHGSSSTVWLAKDHLEKRYLALKILVAAAFEKSTESWILRVLSSGKPDHPGRAYVSSLLDEFVIYGPNGRHLCIVSDAASCSVAQSKETSTTWKFPVNIARAISAQVLLGLDYIHSCGVIHSDLHSNNILFRSPGFKWCTIEDLYRRLGEPQRLPVERLDKNPLGPEVPRYCVLPVMIQSSEEIVDARVVISDFGGAFFNDEERKALHTPILLLPPEVFFHEPIGPAIDIWTLGCTLYDILGDRPLFEGFMPGQNHVIAEMVSTLGHLPKRWWEQWQQRTDFFLEDGAWKMDTNRGHAPYPRPLSERLCIMGRGEDPATCEFCPEEMMCLEKLLGGMLGYEPSERITAGAAVASEWMEKWGQPAIHQTHCTSPLVCGKQHKEHDGDVKE